MIERRDFLRCALAVAVSGTFYPKQAKASAIKTKKLVFVHGRGQAGKDATALRAEWLEALRRGAKDLGKAIPGDVDVVFPFYGDTLDELTRQSAIPLTSDIHARGRPDDDEFLAFQAEFAEALRQRAGVTDAEVDAEYGANPKPRGPLNWEWVQAILRAIDKHTGGMNQRTLETFTRDVFLYATRAGVRDEIDRIVAPALTEEPTVVVSHSLGTIVAYNILRSDRRHLQVPLFVTLGSPLAVRAIRDQFRPLRFPSSVNTWYNAFDPRDVVALYPLDAANFPVQPSIQNEAHISNNTSNRHGIVSYLSSAPVTTQILRALSS